jgi:hypothetical protein
MSAAVSPAAFVGVLQALTSNNNKAVKMEPVFFMINLLGIYPKIRKSLLCSGVKSCTFHT